MNTTNVEQLKDAVAAAHRILYQQGVCPTSIGHVSARIPGTDKLLIKKWRLSFQNVSSEDIITMDFDGRYVEGNGKGPSEIFLHGEVYKVRSDVGAIIHTHQKWALAFGIAGRRILPVYHPGLASFLKEEIPIYESAALIHTP